MNWIETNWETMTTAVLGVVATVSAWNQGKKTAKGSHLDNVDKAVEIWEKLAEKFEAKVSVLEIKHDECEQAKDTLALTLRTLETDMKSLTHDTHECERRYNELSGELAQWKTYVGKHIGFPDKPRAN